MDLLQLTDGRLFEGVADGIRLIEVSQLWQAVFGNGVLVLRPVEAGTHNSHWAMSVSRPARDSSNSARDTVLAA